ETMVGILVEPVTSLPSLYPIGRVTPIGHMSNLDSNIDYVRHPRARRYVIRVRPDGSVRVTVPRWGSLRHAERFAEQQRPWIERERQRAAISRQGAVERTAEELRALRRRAVRELPLRLHA